MNVTAQIVGLLQREDRIDRLVHGRVFGAELPESEVNRMPRMCVVISAMGGADAGAGARSDTPWTRNRFDIRCYAPSPFEADVLHNAVYRVMNGFEPFEDDGVIVRDAVVSGGPLPGRDMATDWPYTLGVYAVSAAYT